MFAAAVGLLVAPSTAGGVAGPGNETRLYKTTARR